MVQRQLSILKLLGGHAVFGPVPICKLHSMKLRFEQQYSGKIESMLHASLVRIMMVLEG
jgi:hypothetical protein